MADFTLSFNFIEFKNAMGVSDVDEKSYGLIIRSVLLYAYNFYGIDFDTFTEVPYDLQYAVYKHAKYIYDTQELKTSVIDTIAEGGGNRASFNPKLPDDIIQVYKLHSPNPKVVLLGNSTV